MSQHAAKQELEVQPREVSVAVFKTSDSRFVGSEASDSAPVHASPATGDLFEITEWGPGLVALKPFSSGRYLSARPGGAAAANAKEIGDAETFTLVRREGNKAALRLSDGVHYLSVSANGEIGALAAGVDQAEIFAIEPLDPAMFPEGGHGCCDAWTRSPEADVVWNDKTHSEIVEWAVHGMRDPKIQTPEARRLVGLWDSRKGFDGSVKQGLKDADYRDPWRGYPLRVPNLPVPILHMYQDHFYSPATRRNYMGEKTSAVTEGRRYFNLAVHTGMRIVQLGTKAPPALYEKAGHYLGLSLHFLTDLTQPMHAANFTNVFADHYPGPLPDFRHKNFEDFTEENIDGFFKGATLTAADLFLDDIQDASWFLHETAVNQKRVYDNILKKVIDGKGFLAPWTVRDSKDTWDASLKKAPGAVARCLAYWSKCITQTWSVSDKRWYRIEEPTLGENICLHGGYFKRSPDTGGHSKYFLLFNKDGTWSLATQDYRNNLWFINDFGTLAEYKGASGEPHNRARFRFVPNAPGSEKIWIFEAGRDEVVGVAGDSWCYRQNPCEPEIQLFKLKDAGEISSGDRTAIANSFSHFGTWPWYGGEA